MHFDYLNLLVFAGVGFAFVFAAIILGALIRPQRKTERGRETYECGEKTIGASWVQFDIRYYTVALIYVIFAVEIAFLFPWAMVIRKAFETDVIGYWAVAKGALFVVILFFGLVAVWAKGDLDWVLAYRGKDYRPESRSEAGPLIPPEEQQPEDPKNDGEAA